MSNDPFGVCLEPECHDETPPKELPSLTTMVKNFVGTAADVVVGAVQGEGVTVSEEVYQERMNICMGCEFFREDKRCTKCGCFMEAKTRFKKTFCPIHKWETFV